jgi:hypothetical protein
MNIPILGDVDVDDDEDDDARAGSNESGSPCISEYPANAGDKSCKSPSAPIFESESSETDKTQTSTIGSGKSESNLPPDLEDSSPQLLLIYKWTSSC